MGMVFQLIALPELDYFKAVKQSRFLGRKTSRTDSKLWDLIGDYCESQPDWCVDTDKAWDMILACFNGPENRYGSDGLLGKSLMGFAVLGRDDSIHGLVPKQVSEVSVALDAYDTSEVDRIIPTLDGKDVYCLTGDDDEAYVKSYIEELRAFYSKSSQEGRAVIAALST